MIENYHCNRMLTRSNGYNSTFAKVAIHWLNQASRFNKSIWLVDNALLRNHQLLLNVICEAQSSLKKIKL